MPAAKATIGHDTIRHWVQRRGGKPAHIESTRRGADPGILRIDVPGLGGPHALRELAWDEFFEWFDRNNLALLYHDEESSRFNKLVNRHAVALVDQVQPGDDRTEAPEALHAIKMLEQQHRELEALFDHYRQVQTFAEKARAFEHVADRFAAHARIEEEIFYPEVYGDDVEGELREALDEHLAVKRVIAELLTMKAEDDQFAAKMASMQQLVENHLSNEEDKLFAMIDDIEPETFMEMGARMWRLYREVMSASPRAGVPGETARAASL
jgi:hemerythrin superfamily protein